MAKKKTQHVDHPTVPSQSAAADDGASFKGKITREVVKSDAFVSLYANDVSLHTTPWDTRLVLGVIGGKPASSENPVLQVTEIGELRMSPQLAKRLTLMLLNQLQTYEKLFGPIPLSKD